MRIAALVVVLVSALAGAEEPSESAAPAFRRGVEALRAHDYAAAAAAFQESYAASPKAAAMCNLALTYDRWGGHVADAIESYRKCAEDDTSGRFRDHALERARQLRASAPPDSATMTAPTTTAPTTTAPTTTAPTTQPETAAPPPVEPPDTTPPPSSAPVTPPLVVAAPPPAVAAPATRSFFKDPAACALTAIGIAGVAVGVGLVAAGEVDDGQIGSTADLGKKSTLYDRAGTLEPAGYIALGVGAALVVVGVIEWAAHGRHAAAATHAGRAEVRF